MEKKILDLEKSLFKYEHMSDPEWLDRVIHDKFVECGKSGRLFDKKVTVDDLRACEEDRKIEIYNFKCGQIDAKTYLVHYITKNIDDLIYRTSIWVEDDGLKLLFHQASKLNQNVELVKF